MTSAMQKKYRIHHRALVGLGIMFAINCQLKLYAMSVSGAGEMYECHGKGFPEIAGT